MFALPKFKSYRWTLIAGAFLFLMTGLGSCQNTEEARWNEEDLTGETILNLTDPAADDDDPPAISRWPMRLEMNGAQVTIYQPQLIELTDNKLSGRAAVSVLRAGQEEPNFGAIWLESRIATDRQSRTVDILDVKVTRTRFPDGPGPTEAALTTGISQATLHDGPMTLSLDQLISMLDIRQRQREASHELRTDPPKIIFRDHPALLLLYDGTPRLSKASPDSNLMRAVNTPFFIALDPSSRTYYLKGGGLWFEARDALGPFQKSASVPPAVAALADTNGYKDPAQRLTDQQAAGLEIITATEPTEVIWTEGPEQMSPIADTGLLYVANTESDVFIMIDSQQLYVLLSGRWYTASSRQGPWEFVAPDKLPDDFKHIPPMSEKGNVLAHVAGTQMAKDAVADTFVPQTAAIDRKKVQQPTVEYDGDPTFEPVEQTKLRYAVNTSQSVLLYNGQYYLCEDAVWYISSSPRGPWELCTAVPPEIYTIPPSCPLYPVRYVYVYDWTPDYVYVGYLPGYYGCYPYYGVVWYGTGYYYHAWHGHHWHSYPCTFGFGAHYDGYNGFWGFSAGFGLEVGTAWFGDHHRPHGGYGEWFGHGGYHAPHPHMDGSHRPTMGPVGTPHRDTNAYAHRTDTLPQPAARRAVTPGAIPRQSPRNNVFADPNGNIYRKGIDGWERREGNRWSPAPKPSAVKPAPAAPARPTPSPAPRPSQGQVPSSLNHDYRARINGANRPSNYPHYATPPRGSAPSRQAPSGGSRGGGGGSHGSGGTGHR